MVLALDSEVASPGKDLHPHPEAGYVGVGIVTGEPMSFAEATVDIDGQPRRLADLPLAGNYVSAGGDEWVVPVRWIKHRPREKAFWKTGMFANQNSATKLRNRFTLDQLTAEFGRRRQRYRTGRDRNRQVSWTGDVTMELVND